MRRPFRILLNIATVLSLVAFLISLLLWDRSFNGSSGPGRTFIRHGIAWHISLEAGDVRIDNAPQREAEARQIERDRLPIERALDREPYGSPAYRQARAEMERFEAEAARRRLFATPAVKHVIPLDPILACSALLPGAWLTRVAYRRRRTWIGHFRGRAALLRVPWLAFGATIVVLWLRSHLMIQDQLVYNIRSPALRRTAAVQLWSLRGQVLLGWGERVYTRQFDFDYEDPANTSNGLAAHSIFPTRLGLNYFNRHLPRIEPQGSFWQRHGFSFQWPQRFSAPRGAAPSTMANAHACVPHWLLLTFWTIPPILWHRRSLRAARRDRLGLCAACAYNLQGNTSGVCPECGTPIVALAPKPPSTNPFNAI